MCLIKTGEVWVRVGKNKWQCRNCGAIVMGKKAPDLCFLRRRRKVGPGT